MMIVSCNLKGKTKTTNNFQINLTAADIYNECIPLKYFITKNTVFLNLTL
jgi:hypothetical protein